jgi:hypothetical protein
VFTARYALCPYIKQIRFVFKGLMGKKLGNLIFIILLIIMELYSRVSMCVCVGGGVHKVQPKQDKYS